MDSVTAVIVAVLGSAVTIGAVVYSAGRVNGAVDARLREIERRLSDIEHALARMGFSFRIKPRGDDDDGDAR